MKSIFIHLLVLFLQKGQDSLCQSQAQTVVDLTFVHNKMHFTEEEFNKMYSQATEQLPLLPPLTSSRQEPFNFTSFQKNTCTNFISAFEDELEKAFEPINFWKCFLVFDPHGLIKITAYGNHELENRIDHYENIKRDMFKDNTVTQDLDIDDEKTCFGW